MRWFKSIFSRRSQYDDLSISIQEHLEQKIDELVEEGMSRADATDVARWEFGNVTQIGRAHV